MHRCSGMLLFAALVMAMPALTRAEPAAAAGQTAATSAATAAENKVEDKVVCKKVKTTGSHFRRRVCQTQSAWRAQREAGQEEHRRMTSRPSTGAPG